MKRERDVAWSSGVDPLSIEDKSISINAQEYKHEIKIDEIESG
jgi:hypothetical protein